MSILSHAFKKKWLFSCVLLASSPALAMEEGSEKRPVGRVKPLVRPVSFTPAEGIAADPAQMTGFAIEKPLLTRSVSCAAPAAVDQTPAATRASSEPSVRPPHSFYWEARLNLDRESQAKLKEFTRDKKQESFFKPLFLIEFPRVEQSSVRKYMDRTGNVIGQSANFETYLTTCLQTPIESRFLENYDSDRCVSSQSFKLQAVVQDAEDPLILWGVLDDPDDVLQDFYTFAEAQAEKNLPGLRDLKDDLKVTQQPQKDSACRIKIGNIATKSRDLDEYRKEAQALAGILNEKLQTSPLEVKFQFLAHASQSESLSSAGVYGIQQYWRKEIGEARQQNVENTFGALAISQPSTPH